MANQNSAASILYLMHVDWRWIKQRPHFLAEQLALTHRVTVLHPLYRRRGRYPRNPTQIRRLPLLPSLNWRHSGLGWLDRRLQPAWVRWVTRRVDPDLLWVTHPLLFPYLPEPAPIVYDCMDDVLGFEQRGWSPEQLVAIERALVDAASLVLCSSAHLKRVIAARHPSAEGKLELVHNGLSGRMLNAGPLPPREPSAEEHVRIAYIGTIAEWLDTSLLTRALDQVPRVTIDLIGPEDGPRVIHDRLVYRGIVAHGQLRSAAAVYDAFIMPFRVTELIRSVDPVKLYEYLGLGREAIAVHYDEIGRFAPYLHFYSGLEQLVALLRQLQDRCLPSRNEPARTAMFLRQNTWEARAAAVNEHLRPLLRSSRRSMPRPYLATSRPR